MLNFILPAVISAGATLFGASKQAKAAKDATRAQTDQAAADRALQQQVFDYERQQAQPLISRGDDATARLRAYYLGRAPRPGQGLGRMTPGAAAPSSAARAYFDANPDLQDHWSRHSDGSGIGGATTPEELAQRHYEQYGRNEGRAWPGEPAAMPGVSPEEDPGAYYTAEQIQAEMDALPLMQTARDDLSADQSLTDAAYADEMGVAAGGRDALYQGADAERAALGALSTAERDRLSALSIAERDRMGALSADERDRLGAMSVAERDRLGALSIAERDRLLGLAREQYDTRRDIDGRAIAAWDARAIDERGRAQDQVTSRFGVTGLAGSSARAMADVGESYARDRALTAADFERRSFEPFASATTSAEAAYFGRGRVDESNFFGRGRVDESNFFGRQRAGEEAYFGRQRAGETAFYGRGRDDERAYYGQRRGADTGYWSQAGTAARGRSAGRATNLQAFRGRRDASRDAYFGYLDDEARIGANARGADVAAYRGFANATSAANQRAADAYSQGRVAQSNIWAGAYGDLADTAGDWWRRRKGSRGAYDDGGSFDGIDSRGPG
jgi:outer membrane murein-binding lipoprotein Lpp